MPDIQINCESRYKTNKEFLAKHLARVLDEEGIKGSTAVSVLICGKRKVRELARRYLRAPEDHNVLSFVYSEIKKPFVDYPDNTLNLGEIVVCYPLAQEEAMEENKMVDQAVAELAEHGLRHLLGQHHEE